MQDLEDIARCQDMRVASAHDGRHLRDSGVVKNSSAVKERIEEMLKQRVSPSAACAPRAAAEDAALRKILDRLSAIEEQLLRVTPASRETAVTPSDIARTPRATSRGSAHFREKTARHRRHLR